MKRAEAIPLRQRILDAAADLFKRQGIRGIGVEAIAAAAGTNKMTLYRYFSSKDELIAEWVRGIVDEKEKDWDDIADAHPGDPQAQLVVWSRRVARKIAEMEGRGSALMNALAELPETDHPARLVIDQHRQRERKRILKLCREAGFAEPELAADQFYFLLEGAKACVQCVGLKQTGEHLVRLVDSMVAARGVVAGNGGAAAAKDGGERRAARLPHR
jgi:AcrR family transcriptional regulator